MCFRRMPMEREGQPRSTIALLVTVVLAVSVVALIASTRPAAPVSTTSASATTSKPQGSATATTSQGSTLSTVTTTSSTISRVADTQSTYAANVTLSSSVTTSSETNTTTSDCPPTSGAPMELQVVSDTTGVPVQRGAPAVSAVYETGCNATELRATDVIYFDGLSAGSSGWFDLPSLIGGFNFTVGYAGHTYSFPTTSAPVSTTCVTLAVPSGVVTLTRYQYSNYDCAGNLGQWAANATYTCFGEVYLRVLSYSDSGPRPGGDREYILRLQQLGCV